MVSFDENSPAVQSHMSILQSVINRMASNSSSAKTWCITLVSALLVVVADKGNHKLTLISFIPTVLFFILDSYYLALEIGFRKSYETFSKKLHTGSLTSSDLYTIAPESVSFCPGLNAARSFSVWPFYALVSLMIVIVYRLAPS